MKTKKKKNMLKDILLRNLLHTFVLVLSRNLNWFGNLSFVKLDIFIHELGSRTFFSFWNSDGKYKICSKIKYKKTIWFYFPFFFWQTMYSLYLRLVSRLVFKVVLNLILLTQQPKCINFGNWIVNNRKSYN